ncbi:MAG: response regulator transcription factor [Kofleriaceae bacterium]
MVRIALAEDHTVVRWALREAVNAVEEFEVVGEAGSAAEALAMIARVKPDVLLLDLTSEPVNEFETPAGISLVS